MPASLPLLLGFAGFTLDPGRGCLRRGADEVPLRPKSYDVLRYLAQNADRLVTKDELLAAVWPNVIVTDDSVVRCVAEVRQALGDTDQRIVRTLPRRGYRLVAPVSVLADELQPMSPVEPIGTPMPAPPPARPETGRRSRRVSGRALVALLLMLIIAAAGASWLVVRHRSAPSTSLPSIAVLPFDDFGGDARQKRLAEAFTDELITELARSRDLLVIARSSSFRYRDRAIDLRQVRRELGVRYVIEGSLEVDPARLRVTVQLVDAAAGTTLWSERYDQPARDLFAVHDDVVRRIVGTLIGFRGPLASAGLEAARAKSPGSLEAYDYYLLSKTPYIRHDAQGMVEARKLLQKAIELDPNLIRAWEVLAWTYWRDAFYGFSSDPARSWELFHETARRAAELDPMDGGAQNVAGMSYFYAGEPDRGLAHWRRALMLSPNDANVLRPIGAQLATATGVENAAEGVELVDRAMRLDPLHPPNTASALGFACYFAGCWERGIVAFHERDSMTVEHRIYLAMSYAQLGQSQAAAGEVALVRQEDPSFTAEAWVDHDFFQPGGSSAALFFDGARKAGLPLCAQPEDAVRLDPSNRLAECDLLRARAASLKD